MTKTRNGILVAMAILSASLLSYAALTLSFSQTDSQNKITPGPSPEEQPYIVESENAFTWPPRDMPSIGNPQMQLVQLQTKPDSFNKINLEEADWLRDIMDRQGERVGVTQESAEEYFTYYKNAKNHNSYLEVTFSDGSVKYYEIIYTEVP